MGFHRKAGFDLSKIFGCGAIALDTYIPTSDVLIIDATIPHSLGTRPRIFILAAKVEPEFPIKHNEQFLWLLSAMIDDTGNMYISHNSKGNSRTDGETVYVDNTNAATSATVNYNEAFKVTDAVMVCGIPKLLAGQEYTVITMVD